MGQRDVESGGQDKAEQQALCSSGSVSTSSRGVSLIWDMETLANHLKNLFPETESSSISHHGGGSFPCLSQTPSGPCEDQKNKQCSGSLIQGGLPGGPAAWQDPASCWV